MADPIWIGRSPTAPRWSWDGRQAIFLRPEPGEDSLLPWTVSIDGGEPTAVTPQDEAALDGADEVDSANGSLRGFIRNGDVFVRHLETGDLLQLTRTPETESDLRFVNGNASLAFRVDQLWHVRDLESGLDSIPFDLRLDDDPLVEDDQEQSYLEDQQKRLFETLRAREDRQRSETLRQRERAAADPTRVGPPFFLGKDNEVVRTALAPDGRTLAVVLRSKEAEHGRHDTLPAFITEDGFIDNQEVRYKVGTEPAAESLRILRLTDHQILPVDPATLPEITVDRLAHLRPEEQPAGAGSASASRSPKADPQPRPIRFLDLQWSPDGNRLLTQIFSTDNKDRWIASVDPASGALSTLVHEFDPAWINRALALAGWLPSSEAFWFQSERSGWSQLYLRVLSEASDRTLTDGRSVVSTPLRGGPELEAPRLTRDGTWLYYTANRDDPGMTEVYRVSTKGGASERVTHLDGVTGFVLSPDEKNLLLLHSTTTRPPELWVQAASPSMTARRLTHTTSREFEAIDWISPSLVDVPTRNDRPVRARLYLPPDDPTASGTSERPRPAVVFVHGAGYLQNAHRGWSDYFREFMFHTLLVQRGFVVLDMDYRGSSGYGRDWRTAIYRQMGTPEVEDLADGVSWLASHHGVDPERVGVYGGSYGGFLTLMALFRQPHLFAAGAALRPVTDWAHYNHGYTSNILNTPKVDPESFERSSPIEFAAGLEAPLLICHGVMDDNVLYLDTARLTQRLIELGKQDWEVAGYPMERHGFREPTSWLDEYRRILKLFETHLH